MGNMKLILSTLPDGQDGEEDNGNQGCRPKTTQGFEGDVSDEVAEEDALQNHTALKNPNQLKSISSGQGLYPVSMTNAYIMAKAEREGMTSWTNFFFTSSPKDRLSEEPKKYPHRSMNKGM